MEWKLLSIKPFLLKIASYKGIGYHYFNDKTKLLITNQIHYQKRRLRVLCNEACEYLRGLRFKLQMMGIPVSDPCSVRGDNKSVLSNISVPSSMLKKKSNNIAFHFVREGTDLTM